MDIEALLIMLALALLAGIVAAPILAIVSLMRTRRLADRLTALEQRLPETAAPAAAAAAAQPAAPSLALPPPLPADPIPATPPIPPAAAAAPTAAPRQGPQEDWESQLGVKVAAWIGMALLLLGAAFFVTYAMQRQWIGPGLRVTLGALFGAGLIVAGHAFDRRAYPRLARALTAGGAALLYFSVYAARAVYDLIGVGPAFLGLVGVSAAVLALAALYNNQWIALGALLGAFFVPPLTDSGTRDGIFFLSYIAALNLPVIGLGLKRRWQALYNTDAVLTWLAYAFAVLSALHGLGPAHGGARLAFAGVFFAQFIALHLLKLWREAVTRRPLDLARLSLNSLAVLWALVRTLTDAGGRAWIGLALLVGAVLHLGLAVVARKRVPRFTDDALAFLLMASTFVALALPMQFDGAWVSAGWIAQGLLLAWFGMRLQAPLLRATGVGVTLLGLGKSQLYDITLYDSPPPLFFNGRFVTGVLAAGALVLQGRWWPDDDKAHRSDHAGWPVGGVLAAAGLIAAAVTLLLDGWLTLPGDAMTATVLGTLLVAGLAAAMHRGLGGREDGIAVALTRTAWALLGLVTVKMLVYDLWVLADWSTGHGAPFLSGPFYGLLAAAGLAGATAGAGRDRRTATLHLLAAASAVGVTTAEWSRLAGPWRGAAVTLFWATAAMACIGVGLRARRRYLRWFGLALLGASAIKALLVDLAGLRGPPRIAAFLGAGTLWLVLSFVYQRISRARAESGGAAAGTGETPS